MRTLCAGWLMLGLIGAAAGCRPTSVSSSAARSWFGLAPSPAPVAISLKQIDLSDPALPQTSDGPVALTAARNEWVSFAIQLTSAADGYRLRLHPPALQGSIGAMPAGSFEAFQVLSVPVDMDRAAYVRHTGQSTETRSLPRALLPQKLDLAGTLALKDLRDPLRPSEPVGHGGSALPATLWIDLHVPPLAAAGEYLATVDIMHDGNDKAIVSLPLHLTVYDFNLPNERHLQMVGRLMWDRLQKLYPDRFESVTPTWVNRREDRYRAAVKMLDDLMALSQANRTALIIPALRPVTKWPAGQGPDIDWRDFDSMVGPWFSGEASADRIGLRYWPIPAAAMLDRYDRNSQLQYWSQAADHFAQKKWLDFSAIALEKLLPGRIKPAERLELSAEAAEILKSHPAVRVLLPLEDDQLQFTTRDGPNLINPATTGRLLTTSPALVSTPPTRAWPQGAAKPTHWLRTDLPGLVPYVGAGGNERDVRVWAWLAFLRHVTTYGNTAAHDDNFILWDNILPGSASPAQPADPNELIWFYPGSWFGIDQPVPTIQLKWLRKAEQDYEYLLLARDRGEVINALQMARLITRPVELQPGQAPDPVYSLMSGTSDAKVWDDARKLLARTILLRPPGKTPDSARQQELYLRTMQWAAPNEKPLLMARTVDWSLASASQDRRDPGTWVALKLGLDIYNASETTPDQNRLRWSQVPAGWEDRTQQIEVPRLRTYHVLRTMMDERFNLDRISPQSRQPIELQFVDGFRNVVTPIKVMLPVAASERRDGPLRLDAALDDWSAADQIQNGPMVQMLDRPAVQRQELRVALTPSRVLSGWGQENFYVAFALDGPSPASGRMGRNFVEYQQRRAWGEDLCEILIQPIDSNNRPGPVVHVICKPNGAVSIERKLEALGSALPMWQSIDGAAVRYASAASATHWQGELAIPWTLITGPDGGVPTLLRFNFIQHRAATGESASWAGPIDYGRDDSFMGLLYLRTSSPLGRGQ